MCNSELFSVKYFTKIHVTQTFIEQMCYQPVQIHIPGVHIIQYTSTIESLFYAKLVLCTNKKQKPTCSTFMSVYENVFLGKIYIFLNNCLSIFICIHFLCHIIQIIYLSRRSHSVSTIWRRGWPGAPKWICSIDTTRQLTTGNVRFILK